MRQRQIRRSRFLVVGRAGMDFYADPPGTRLEEARMFSAMLGGSAANTTAGIVRLGGEASIVTLVSDDAVGRFVMNELRSFGIDVEHVRMIDGEARSSLAVVETRLEECQSVIYRNGAADLQLTEADLRKVEFSRFGALILTGTCLAREPSRSATFFAMASAREAGLPVILDVDHRPYSWNSREDATAAYRQAAILSDIVVGNEIEFDVMAGEDGGLEHARQLASEGRLAVYKMGDKGSLVLDGSDMLATGVFKVDALKPTGAGDAFMAGFAMGLAAGREIRESVQRGSAAAAIVVTRVGCARAMPTSTELDAFLSANPLPSAPGVTG